MYRGIVAIPTFAAFHAVFQLAHSVKAFAAAAAMVVCIAIVVCTLRRTAVAHSAGIVVPVIMTAARTVIAVLVGSKSRKRHSRKHYNTNHKHN